MLYWKLDGLVRCCPAFRACVFFPSGVSLLTGECDEAVDDKQSSDRGFVIEAQEVERSGPGFERMSDEGDTLNVMEPIQKASKLDENKIVTGLNKMRELFTPRVASDISAGLVAKKGMVSAPSNTCTSVDCATASVGDVVPQSAPSETVEGVFSLPQN